MGSHPGYFKGLKSRGLVAFCLFLFYNATAQVQVVDRVNASPAGKDAPEARFPIVQGPDSAVINKINRFLQLTWLRNTPKSLQKGTDIFERTAYQHNDSGVRSGYTNIDYGIVFLSPRILSLRLDLETMAAYPESYSHYQNFNLQNGTLILTADLFTPEGLQQLRSYLREERKKIIKEAGMAAIAEKMNKEDQDYISQSLTECNLEAEENNAVIDSAGMIFFRSHCFPHVARGMEADLSVRIPSAMLSPWLNAYGKKIFIEPTADIRNDGMSGLLKPMAGTIGKYPVVLILERLDGNYAAGYYYYQSREIAIEISGERKGNNLVLHEYDEEGSTGTIRATISGNALSGTWTGSNGKQLSFSVKN